MEDSWTRIGRRIRQLQPAANFGTTSALHTQWKDVMVSMVKNFSKCWAFQPTRSQTRLILSKIIIGQCRGLSRRTIWTSQNNRSLYIDWPRIAYNSTWNERRPSPYIDQKSFRLSAEWLKQGFWSLFDCGDLRPFQLVANLEYTTHA